MSTWIIRQRAGAWEIYEPETKRIVAQGLRKDEATVMAASRELLGGCEEALIMAENLRKATGDAIPGALCFTLHAAIAKAKPETYGGQS